MRFTRLLESAGIIVVVGLVGRTRLQNEGVCKIFWQRSGLVGGILRRLHWNGKQVVSFVSRAGRVGPTSFFAFAAVVSAAGTSAAELFGLTVGHGACVMRRERNTN